MMKLVKFWFFLLAAAVGVYLIMYNQDRVYVHLKGIGEFKIIAGLAYFSAFIAGALTVTLYIITDIFRKSFEIHKLSRKTRSLERNLEGMKDSPSSIAKPVSQPEVALESHH